MKKTIALTVIIFILILSCYFLTRTGTDETGKSQSSGVATEEEKNAAGTAGNDEDSPEEDTTDQGDSQAVDEGESSSESSEGYDTVITDEFNVIIDENQDVGGF